MNRSEKIEKVFEEVMKLFSEADPELAERIRVFKALGEVETVFKGTESLSGVSQKGVDDLRFGFLRRVVGDELAEQVRNAGSGSDSAESDAVSPYLEQLRQLRRAVANPAKAATSKTVSGPVAGYVQDLIHGRVVRS
jgi:hypothetical protein